MTASPTDEQRWAEALEALGHGPTPAVRARVRRLRLLLSGLVVLALVPALLIPVLLADGSDRSTSDEPTTALDVAGLVVRTVAVLVQATALVGLVRANRGRSGSPLVVLTRQHEPRTSRPRAQDEPAAG